jgi:Tfp pilus assembly protein PilV
MKVDAFKNRRGSMLVEVTMATVILMIVMTVAVKTLALAARERSAAERRERALAEASNVMERLTAEPFDEVTPERAHALVLPPLARQVLAHGELSVDVSAAEPAPGGVAAKRVAVGLRWRNRTGEWETPVRLTSWIYRRRAHP